MTESEKISIATLQAQVDELQRKSKNIPENCISHTEILKSINDKIDSINDNLKWIWRTIIGAIILIMIGLIFSPYTPQNNKTGAKSNDTTISGRIAVK